MLNVSITSVVDKKLNMLYLAIDRRLKSANEIIESIEVQASKALSKSLINTSFTSSLYCLIVRVRVVLKRTVVGD